MAGQIFYRERTKVGEGEKKPRYMLVAVAGLDLKVFAKHLRQSELEEIAGALGAELVLLERRKGAPEEEAEVEVPG